MIVGVVKLSIVLSVMILVAGCTTNSSQTNTELSKHVATYIPQTYDCFEVSDVVEEDYASGYTGKNIADIRRVTGKLTNTCPRIMTTYVYVHWFDENGKGAYYGQPIHTFRLKSGESVNFKTEGYHVAVQNYGYLEEVNNWTYKILVGDNLWM